MNSMDRANHSEKGSATAQARTVRYVSRRARGPGASGQTPRRDSAASRARTPGVSGERKKWYDALAR
jgi:hypothetical protein